MKHVTDRPTDDQQMTATENTDTPLAEETTVNAPPEIGRRILQPRTLLGFLIAAVALYFFYKRGFDLDFREVWARMRSANGWILLLTFVVYYTSFIFRTLRWQTLLANVGYSREQGVPIPSAWGLGEILYLSWFANCVTVARLGDAYRGYMLKRSAGVSFTVTLGTIFAERLIDLVVLAGLMAVSTFAAFHGVLPPEAEQALIGGVVLAGGWLTWPRFTAPPATIGRTYATRTSLSALRWCREWFSRLPAEAATANWFLDRRVDD